MNFENAAGRVTNEKVPELLPMEFSSMKPIEADIFPSKVVHPKTLIVSLLGMQPEVFSRSVSSTTRRSSSEFSERNIAFVLLISSRRKRLPLKYAYSPRDFFRVKRTQFVHTDGNTLSCL